MTKVAAKGVFICEDDKRVFAVDADLYEDGSVKLVKGAEVLSKAKDGSEGPLKKDTVLPIFKDVVSKAQGRVTKADNLVPKPNSSLRTDDIEFIPNGGFKGPGGLGSSSARMPDGSPPIAVEIDGGSGVEIEAEKALANARARKAARERRATGPSIETSKL